MKRNFQEIAVKLFEENEDIAEIRHGDSQLKKGNKLRLPRKEVHEHETSALEKLGLSKAYFSEYDTVEVLRSITVVTHGGRERILKKGEEYQRKVYDTLLQYDNPMEGVDYKVYTTISVKKPVTIELENGEKRKLHEGDTFHSKNDGSLTISELSESSANIKYPAPAVDLNGKVIGYPAIKNEKNEAYLLPKSDYDKQKGFPDGVQPLIFENAFVAEHTINSFIIKEVIPINTTETCISYKKRINEATATAAADTLPATKPSAKSGL